jgi:hypothetical protein
VVGGLTRHKPLAKPLERVIIFKAYCWNPSSRIAG